MKYLLMFIALCFCVGIAFLAYTLKPSRQDSRDDEDNWDTK